MFSAAAKFVNGQEPVQLVMSGHKVVVFPFCYGPSEEGAPL